MIASSLSFFVVRPVWAVTTFLNDDFENFNTNNWWSLGGSPVNILRTSELKHGGSYSVVWNTTSNYFAYAFNQSLVTSSDYHMSVWIWVNGSVSATNTVIFGAYSASAGAYRALTTIFNNASGYYVSNMNSSLANVPMFAISTDTWHHLEGFVNRTTGYVRYWLDAVFKVSAGNASNGSVERFYFGDVSGTAPDSNGKVFYDDLLIDTSPETPYYVTVYRTSGGVYELNGLVYNNATVFELGISTINLSALVNGANTYSFDNFTYGATSSSNNPLQIAISSNLTVWCYFVPVVAGGGGISDLDVTFLGIGFLFLAIGIILAVGSSKW